MNTMLQVYTPLAGLVALQQLVGNMGPLASMIWGQITIKIDITIHFFCCVCVCVYDVDMIKMMPSCLAIIIIIIMVWVMWLPCLRLTGQL